MQANSLPTELLGKLPFKMKEQYKTLEEELSEVEISLLFFNLHEKEFRVVIVKIIKEFGKRMDAH